MKRYSNLNHKAFRVFISLESLHKKTTIKNTNMRNARNGHRTVRENRKSGMGNVTPTVIAFAAGAVAGAVTALLLAPQTGAETRRTLGGLYDQAKEGISDFTGLGMEEEEETEFRGSVTPTGRSATSYGSGRTTQSGGMGRNSGM